MKVLVVEGDRDGADSLAAVLRYYGHEVAVAADVATGLRSALAFRPDAVLFELALPDGDGCELAERLLAAESPRTPLLVAISAWASAEHRRRSAAAGVHYHMAKPVAPADVQSILLQCPVPPADPPGPPPPHPLAAA